MAIWRIRRRARDAALSALAALFPRLSRSIMWYWLRCQRLATAGSMPIASITSALRTVEAMSLKERAAASLACASGRRVSTSVSTLIRNRKAAAPSASQP